MSYVVFARKWRPKDFDEVIGQEYITTTLKNAITSDRVAHAYIFTGPRGIGKTSVARIFAKGLNCEKGPTPSPCNKCSSCEKISSSSSMDVIEIDGASNNSVDQVRELRENIKFAPSYAKYKIYIIDEVHMLSIGAFNALLKTLEEPPKHAKFIFATTHPEKVPATILSRCQRFDFSQIPLKSIMSKLKKITETEKLKVSDDALFSIARASEGSMRDAESILDQLTSFCEKEISQDDVIALLGMIKEDRLADIVHKLSAKDTAGLLKSIDELITAGKDMSQFLTGLMGYIRNLMVLKVSSGLASLIDLPDSRIDRLKEEIKDFQIEELLYIFYTLSATANAIKRSEVSRFIVEATFIKLSLRDEMMSLPQLMDRISSLGLKQPVANAPRKPKPVDEPAAKEPAPEEPAQDQNESAIAPEPIVTLDLESIKKAWPQILEAVKNKKISIGSYLAEGEIIKAEGPLITLNFAKRFNLHREVLEKNDNRKFVEEIASGVSGKDIKLAFVTLEEYERAEDGAEDLSAAGEDEGLEQGPVSDGVSENSIVRSAMDMFGGKIVKNKERFDKGRRPSK